MITKDEILEKVSEIIINSKDEQVILNASHFLYYAIKQKEFEIKTEEDRLESKEKMKSLGETMKTLLEV